MRGANKMSDRKYKQHGYMDSDRESSDQAPIKPQDREGPLTIRMMAWRDVEVRGVRGKGSAEHQRRQLLPKVQR